SKPQFGLKVGVNLFGGALALADVGISKTESGDTQVDGDVSSAESLPVFGKLSFHLTYTCKADGSGQSLAIRNWPSFKIAEQLFDMVAKIKELADTAQSGGCGSLASYVVKQALTTKYAVTPSVDTHDNEPKFSLTLTCSMHFGPEDYTVMEWNP